VRSGFRNTYRAVRKIWIARPNLLSASAQYESLLAMRIRYKPWMPASALAAVIFTIWFLSWWGGQPSIRPRDMPRDSVWIHAPNLPFEWHHGWWFGCWIDSDGHSNRCRLWGGQGDKPIVFEGLYISCKDHSPVPASELKLKAPPDSSQMWVGGPAPAAFLQNGDYLVPVVSPHGCEELTKVLKQ
jgi:hypothetical protein